MLRQVRLDSQRQFARGTAAVSLGKLSEGIDKVGLKTEPDGLVTVIVGLGFLLCHEEHSNPILPTGKTPRKCTGVAFLRIIQTWH